MIDVTVDVTGLEEALDKLKPQRLNAGVKAWYQRVGAEGRNMVRSRAPNQIKRTVAYTIAPGEFPASVRIRPRSRLAHIIESGTGLLGDGGTKHKGRYFPNVTSLAKNAGLPMREAFLVARKIHAQGGIRPRPFVRPVAPTIEARAVTLAQQMLAGVWA
jgi:hypothetical protein